MKKTVAFTQKKRALPLTLTLLLLMGGLSGCSGQTAETKPPETAGAERAVFAAYNEPAVTVNPQVPEYEVAANLANVENAERFEIAQKAVEQLVKQGFAVEKGFASEFFGLYEGNRYNQVPNFVTTDSILHTYHLYYDYLLRNVEENQLRLAVQTMTDELLLASQEQAGKLTAGDWKSAAERNIAYFSVAAALLNGGSLPEVTATAKTAASQELTLIKEAQGITESPVMNLAPCSQKIEPTLEDYSQYIPRGHYTKSEALKQYFKGMMWYGRQTFRIQDEQQLKSAALISQALQQSKAAAENWQNVYETTNFFAGESDDPSLFDLNPIVKQIYGETYSLTDLTDSKKFADFQAAAEKMPLPVLNSMPISISQSEEERDAKIAGVRLMGQRYTIDADVFQQLIYPKVGQNAKSEQRMLPDALDIPAAFGATAAEKILKERGDFDYADYGKNLTDLKMKISALEGPTWTSNLYWAWMNMLRPLTADVPKGYPSFMLKDGWKSKNLNTFKGSWTELKHDTLLYSKQVYAEMGGPGGDEERYDDRGYVEPVPMLYARLAALTEMTRIGLESRRLVSKEDVDNLKKLETLARSLLQISIKELENQELTEDEYELIRSYGGQLEHFWLDTLKDEPNKDDYSALMVANPAALIADVATDPNSGSVLEEGTGHLDAIYVVVPVAGKLKIASGAIWSTYEFTVPLADRLTDEQWREMLMEDEKSEGYFDWTGAVLRYPDSINLKSE